MLATLEQNSSFQSLQNIYIIFYIIKFCIIGVCIIKFL